MHTLLVNLKTQLGRVRVLGTTGGNVDGDLQEALIRGVNYG